MWSAESTEYVLLLFWNTNDTGTHLYRVYDVGQNGVKNLLRKTLHLLKHGEQDVQQVVLNTGSLVVTGGTHAV